ncbi:hypothetical protein FGF1_35000 [Flavobacteriaceae bacterium GF1]
MKTTYRAMLPIGALLLSFLVSAQATYNGSTKHTFTTNHGTIEIGPFNSSHGHIYTDRPNIIFNKDVYTTTNAFSSYNNDLLFKTEGNERMRIDHETGHVGIGYSSPLSPLHIASDTDAIQTFQTSDDSWLYTNWKSSNGTRKAYMGLSTSLSEFRIQVENGTNEILFLGGNVGIGTYTPLAQLHVEGNGIRATTFSLSTITDLTNASPWYGLGRSDFMDLSNTHDRGAVQVAGYYGLLLKSASGFIGIHQNGRVGIGTTAPDAKLTVKGNIHAEEIKVDLAVPAPDYVFKEGYELKSLEEVQNYIQKHGHLPNIPSAKELEANGIQLGEMDMKLLEKIEELTLYLIAQERIIERLQKQNTIILELLTKE